MVFAFDGALLDSTLYGWLILELGITQNKHWRYIKVDRELNNNICC